MAYKRVNWENLPSTNTPVNADNLNKMDEGIANAVEKTGDTLTGSLNFNNKNDFEAIRKTRTLNNEDYQVTVGVGANMAARMEFIKLPDNVLGSVEARSDGIYNGVSGKKLLEIKTKTINNAPVNNYGNVDLGLWASSAMVLGVNFANYAFNSIPFINVDKWYCYVVKNQPQSVINLQQSGTVTTTVYYVEI